MTDNLRGKSLIAIVLLCSFSSLAAAVAQENENLAPQVTAAEAALSFSDIPYLEDAFIDPAPADRTDGLVTGELGVDGGDNDMIVRLAQEIAGGVHGRFDSLLIAHKDKLLFESYFLRGRIDLPHYQASVTKAYTNLAIGRAIQLGYLTMADLDKPLIGFLKDLNTAKLVEGAEMITLHKAMTMRSGIRISEEDRAELRENPDKLGGQGQVQVYLEHSRPIAPDSQSYLYQGIDTQLTMQVLDAVAPDGAEDFIKNELLDKLGVSVYEWRTDVSGLPAGPSGSNMTSRDMVKWGMLALNKGEWNGEQLVPEEFIAKSTGRIVQRGVEDIFFVGGAVSNPGYGYYWWRADLKAGGKSYLSVSAQGGGGQYIILIDELDLIVVTTAHDQDVSVMQMTAERILPAFIQ